MGTPEFSVTILDALATADHDIVAVYCQPPRRAGRGKQKRPSPVQVRATELGLPLRHPVNFKVPKDVADFAALKADVAVVVAYGLILPQALLDAPKYGCLNIHASLLPRWRGAAPIHRAIMAGDEKTGICIMQMEAGLDTGPVLLKSETAITCADTTLSLHNRLANMGATLIVEALSQIQMLKPQKQPQNGVTYADKIDKAEAHIDWSEPAVDIDRKIRALSPFPGAWCRAGDERIKLLNSELAQGTGQPGQVLDTNLTIACGTGAVRLTSLQRAGKSAMPPSTLLLGFDLPVGTILT